MARALLTDAPGGNAIMAARSEQTDELHPRTLDASPDESGTRARPDEAAPFDELEVELIEPPPPPRRLPPPPLSALVRERVDIDAILRDAQRAPLPVLPSAPPLVLRSRARPTWGVAIALSTSALVVGAAIAVMVVVTDRAGEAVPASSAVMPAPARPIAPRADLRRSEPRRPAASATTPASPATTPVSIATTPASIATTPAATPDERVEPARPRRGHFARARRVARHVAAPRPREPAAPAEHHDDALPEHPSRTEVEHAVQAILPAVRECAPGLGLVHLRLHFLSNGHATTAEVDAAHATPAQRSCIARAARGASVSPFSAPQLTVRYPATL